MKKRYLTILLIAFTVLSFRGLQMSYEYPDHFPPPHYNFDNNPISTAKIKLGLALFYDPVLSRDGSISCASCHSPYNAFAHTDHDLSHGIDDRTGTRNAPALFNLAWHKNFMWDGAVNHLDMQPLAPISHPDEMDDSLENVAEKLKNKSIYKELFTDAWQDSSISGERILKSLSAFQLTLISSGSKYDKVKEGKDSFSEQENKGYQLFQQHCNSCHTEPLFSSYKFANNGLPVDSSLQDFGRWKISKRSEDSLLFKVPSLRNLSFSFPYMHDGRFKKLRQVINHYTKGIIQHKTLSEELKKPIELTDHEKTDLISFLLTLDDKDFVFNRENKFPRDILLKAQK